MDTTDASSGKHEIMNWFHVFSFGWLEVLWMNHFFNGLSLRPLTVLSGRRCDWAVYVRLMKWGVDARVSLEKMKLIRPKWSFCHHLLSLMCSNLCEFSSSPKHEDILINVSGCHKSMLFGSQHSFIMFSRRKTLMQRCWNSSVSVFTLVQHETLVLVDWQVLSCGSWQDPSKSTSNRACTEAAEVCRHHYGDQCSR